MSGCAASSEPVHGAVGVADDHQVGHTKEKSVAGAPRRRLDRTGERFRIVDVRLVAVGDELPLSVWNSPPALRRAT